jgi:hypothetical protein
MSGLGILYFTAGVILFVIILYLMILAIQALKIYIKKNKE